MIFVVKQKRLNDFKHVCCVKPRDLYSRLGHRVPDTNFESSDENIPMNMNKIDSIEYLEKYDAMRQRELDRAGTEAQSDGNSDSKDFNED